jgi:hypothetical protein
MGRVGDAARVGGSRLTTQRYVCCSRNRGELSNGLMPEFRQVLGGAIDPPDRDRRRI